MKRLIDYKDEYNGLVTKKNLTGVDALRAVRWDTGVLRYVTEQTEEICLEAVRQSGHSLCHVSRDLRTKRICLEAVRRSGNALQYVPDSLMTEEMCLEAVRQNGCALRFVPKYLITEEICLEAVKRTGSALRYVDSRFFENDDVEIILNGNKTYISKDSYEALKELLK